MTKLWTRLSLLSLCLAWTACDKSTGPSGTGDELPPGHYFILSDNDDFYRFDQYLVVLPGHAWEFVEYGYPPGQKANLCQVTRQGGVYSTTDTSITMTATKEGESLQKCGLTKAEFQAYPFTAVPSHPKQTFALRNVTATGFEAEDLFIGADTWVMYRQVADPYGFY